MAAEAFLYDEVTKKVKTGQQLIDALKAGNKHASKFTEVLAKAFAERWEVVDQKANTATGFSGTLFRDKANPNELVLSSPRLFQAFSFSNTEPCHLSPDSLLEWSWANEVPASTAETITDPTATRIDCHFVRLLCKERSGRLRHCVLLPEGRQWVRASSDVRRAFTSGADETTELSSRGLFGAKKRWGA